MTLTDHRDSLNALTLEAFHPSVTTSHKCRDVLRYRCLSLADGWMPIIEQSCRCAGTVCGRNNWRIIAAGDHWPSPPHASTPPTEAAVVCQDAASPRDNGEPSPSPAGVPSSEYARGFSDGLAELNSLLKARLDELIRREVALLDGEESYV